MKLKDMLNYSYEEAYEAVMEVLAKVYDHAIEVEDGTQEVLDMLLPVPSAVSQPGWQPISTAPTNKAVLLYKPKGAFQHAMILCGYFTHGWICVGLPTPDKAPTHWMPLPEPPEAQA